MPERKLAEDARERLQELMEHEGITPKELSRRSGVSDATIYRILHNKQVPTLSIYESLIEGLGYEVSLRID